MSVTAGSVTEGALGVPATVDFAVTLSAVATSDVTITYSTSDDTATLADLDYSASSGDTLVIPAGQTSGTIFISVTGDNNIELDENFNLQISNAQNATITGGSQTVAGTILTDDSLAGYYTGGASVNEGMGNLVIPDGDFQVIADTDRIVIIDTTGNDLTNRLVYVVTIDAFTSETEFTGTASIYRSGNRLLDANSANLTTSVSGVLDTNDQSLALTLTGTGDYTTGTIDLNYSAKNSVVSVDLTIEAVWGASSGGFGTNTATNINISTNGNVVSDELNSCSADSVELDNVITEQTGRVRSFAASNLTLCLATGSLEGYITSFDTTIADDTVVFVWFNENGVHGATLQ